MVQNKIRKRVGSVEKGIVILKIGYQESSD